MYRKKIITSALLTTGMFIAPLAGKPELMLSPHTIIFCLISFASLLAQPAIDVKEIRKNRTSDGFTAAMIMGTILLAQVGAVVEWAYFNPHPHSPFSYASLVGYILLVMGFGLRTWAIYTLDSHFTATVPDQPKKELIKKGPYRILRHPSYTGGLIGVTAISIILTNTLTPVLTFGILLLVYLLRIDREETHLRKSFGEEYNRYQANTWRLFPFIW